MKKILIVEDDIDIRENLSELFDLKGFEVVTAANGKEGLFVASTQKPDIILSDVMMPEMNGFDFLELVQKNKDLAGIPFVFLTAKVEHLSIRQGMNLGADDYLTKPVRYKELIGVINRRIEKAENIKKKVEDDMKSIVAILNKTVSHEFNTPLNGILGFAQLLKKKKEIPSDKMVMFGELIEDSGKRLKKTLDDILLYRSIISNSLNCKKEEFFLSDDIIESISKDAAQRYSRANDLIISSKLNSKIIGSSKYLSKILWELIDNSFKFSKTDEKVVIEENEEDNHCKIIIKDNGRGMTLEQIDEVTAFKQFEREKYEQQGMGLGLFLSLELAKLNNWQLILKKNSPKGMCCELII